MAATPAWTAVSKRKTLPLSGSSARSKSPDLAAEGTAVLPHRGAGTCQLVGSQDRAAGGDAGDPDPADASSGLSALCDAGPVQMAVRTKVRLRILHIRRDDKVLRAAAPDAKGPETVLSRRVFPVLPIPAAEAALPKDLSAMGLDARSLCVIPGGAGGGGSLMMRFLPRERSLLILLSS